MCAYIYCSAAIFHTFLIALYSVTLKIHFELLIRCLKNRTDLIYVIMLNGKSIKYNYSTLRINYFAKIFQERYTYHEKYTVSQH